MGMRFIGIEGNRDCYSPQQVSSCTVGEFIEYLSNYDEDMPLYLVNDNGYTFGSLGQYDVSEHYINDDGDLDGEEDEDDEYKEDDDLNECRLHIEESDNGNIKLTINKIAKADTLSQIKAALKSLGTTGEKLLTKYAKFMSKAPSPGKVGDVLIKELTKLLQNADDLILTDDCESYKSHMHESHRIRKNKLCIKRTHKHPKLMK